MSFKTNSFESHNHVNYLDSKRIVPLKIKFHNDSHVTQVFEQSMNDLNKDLSSGRGDRNSNTVLMAKDMDVADSRTIEAITMEPFSPNKMDLVQRTNNLNKELSETLHVPKAEVEMEEPLPRNLLVKKLVAAPFVDKFEPKHQYGPDYVMAANSLKTSLRDGAVQLRLPREGMSSVRPLSVVTFLKQTVEKFPNNTALAVKRNDEWQKWTYSQYWNDIRTAAKGFIKLGLEPFKSVGILGFNSPEWFLADLGAIFAGGIVAGIYTTNSANACLHILKDSAANIVVVENELQLKKILQIRAKLPNLRAIIQYTGEPKADGVLSWNDLMEIGATVSDDVLERRIKGQAVNQCCTLIYTSGTTGDAKGVMLSQDNLTFLARVPEKVMKAKMGEESLVSYLPLSHIAAQIVDLYVGIAFAGQVNFAAPDALKGSLVETLKDIRPTVLMGVPRIWEKIVEKLQDTERSMPPFKKALFSWARSLGTRYNLNRCNGSNSMPLLFPIANKFILKKVHQALGFDQLRMAFSGAAPISSETLNYLMSLNIVVMETYGMSESSGPHTLNILDKFKMGSVGQCLPDVETKIDNPDHEGNGEICMFGRHVFMGYLNMNDKTEEVIDSEGWLHTGDIGQVDANNFLSITGRIKEILITAGGENVAPIPIEDLLKQELPILSNCMLIGDKCKFLSVLLTLKTYVDIDTLVPSDKLLPSAVDWCRSVGSSATTVKEILQGPDSKVMDAIQQGINRANAKAVSNAQRVQKWVILPEDFSLPGGELGPTLKLKRPFVSKKYKDTIDRFYSDC